MHNGSAVWFDTLVVFSSVTIMLGRSGFWFVDYSLFGASVPVRSSRHDTVAVVAGSVYIFVERGVLRSLLSSLSGGFQVDQKSLSA